VKKKILHIITGIGAGGAEKVMLSIVSNDKQINHYVISLRKKNFIKTPYSIDNEKIFYLNLNRFNFLIKFFTLTMFIYKFKPDIVQTWMYHADFFGGLAAKLAECKKIFWNIRNSSISKETKKLTKFIIIMNVFLSYIIPNKVISCSEFAKIIHIKKGFKNNFLIIHNGFYETKKNIKLHNFSFYNSRDFVITFIGRWHPQKDFDNLFKSLKIFQNFSKCHNWKIFLAGNQLDNSNLELNNLINKYGLKKNVNLLGQINCIESFFKNSDINLLTSKFGEAFPNVLIESMFYGTPCISTDIGEARYIISNCGWVVPKNNAYKFALSINEAYKKKQHIKSWFNLKLKCSLRIKNFFLYNKMISKYHKAWSI